MQISEIIDFLETDTMSVSFSDKGLKYLSLRGSKGDEIIDLRSISKEKGENSKEYILLKETWNFIKNDSHQMILDLSSFTAFQQAVFDAVSKVKAGNISTYKGIAEMLGKPGAAQAVGSAVAKNPVSYFIPTHRVLPQKGIGICKSGAGFLREKLLIHEGHDIEKLRGNYKCTRKKCCME